MGHGVTLVSSADETAFAARRVLGELGLLRSRRSPASTASCRAATSTRSASSASQLLGPELNHTARWVPPAD